MDPVTAVGLASGIVAFITLSTSLVKGAIKIHESLDGNLDENRSREAIASEMSRFATRLLPPDSSHLAGEEKALCVLAMECRDLSVKLRELLGRIKPKEPRSKSQSLWSVLKNKVTEKEKAELELLLDHCRSQFNLQLAFVNKSLLHSLAESARNDAAKLELLRSNVDDLRARIEDLRQGVQVAGFSSEAQDLIRRLVDVQENAFSAIVQGRILDALAFEEMYGRSEMVEEAHYRTFRWILADDNEDDNEHNDDVCSTRCSEPERREVQRAAGAMFTNWLSSSEGIFHISGKLGSGKSTLMKYLGDHPGTKTELIKWADGRDLVVAKFFFWRPGTPKQKSLDGLYRSLLHDILKSRPELIPETLRELYDEARATPWQVQTTLLISEKDIRRAFARLIQSTDRADASHCFCFFIDGLDEYQETAQNDLKEMVQLLTSWTVAAPRHVKLCVSSREYNVFMNSFSAEKRLRVHELTRFDMQAYIRDKLNGITDEVAKHELVSAIVAKAEGIFQWVTLVVKQIREELENGADSVALIQLVDSLPDELDRLYQHVLQSLSKSDRRKVYQTFAILSLANQWELSVSLFAYSFLEDYGADPTFAEREDFVQRARARGDGGTVEYRVELGRKRVRGWCKGLVEPVSIGRAGWDEVMIIDYAHRSIPDSLENKTIKDEMEAFLAGFSPAEALCQLILTEIRLDSHHRKPRICSAEFLAAVMGPLVKMRHAHHLDHAPFTFLRVLDTFADPWCWKKIEMGSTDLAIWVQDHWSGFYPIAQMNKDPGPVRTSHPTRWGSAQSTSLPGVLYHCALLIPGHEYPKWRIENDPTATDSVAKVVLVAYTLLASSDLYVDDEKFSWSGLDALLDRGLLTSKTETRLVPGPFPLIAAQVSTDNSGVDTNLAGSELSFWRYFLIHEWCLHEIRKGRGPGSPDARKDITHRDNLRFSAVVERFLLRGLVGADSRFAVSYPSLEKRRVEFRFWCDLAGNRGTTTENLPGSVTCLVELSSKIGTLEPQTAVYEVAERQGKRTYMCSLRRWIEDSEALPNKEELLRLLEREECSLSDGRSPGVESEGSQLRTPWAAPEHIRVSYALTLTVGVPLLAFFISFLPLGAVAKGLLPFGRS